MWTSALLFAGAAVVSAAVTVDPLVLSALEIDELVPVMVMLGHPAGVLSGVKGTDSASVHQMVSKLQAHALETQKPVLELLSKQGNTTSLWINNAVAGLVNRAALSSLEALAGLAGENSWKVLSDKMFKIELEHENDPHPLGSKEARAPEWNVEWVKAPAVWARGFRGKGLVHGNADTGIEFTHEALAPHYRGRGTTAVHDYNWWDATQNYTIPPGQTSRCVKGTPTPCDDNGHGTHTVGTTVGEAPGGLNQIGVAPDAEWIGCRNMYAGYGSPSTYIGCLEFFTAPTDLAGKNPDPARRAHTIGNSYGCPSSEGCSIDSFIEALKVVRAAGVFMSVSNGNAGSRCSTTDAPPGLNADVCSVGASGFSTNTIASYSSRGPVTQDGSGRRKPDITAPGSSVRSAYPGNTYRSLSGTSMASPAVAGVVLLLWEAFPELARDIDRTEQLLYDTATPLYNSAATCDPRPDTHPNNVYGYGMIDAEKAFNTMEKGAK